MDLPDKHDGLPPGKLPPELLEEHVLTRVGVQRREVLVPAALGEDAAIIDLDDGLCTVAVDPITGAGSGVGWLAVHVSCNDVAAHGAEPLAVLLCVMVPPEQGLDAVKDIMSGAGEAAEEVGVQIAGGHTELTPGLLQPIVTATAVGRAPRQGYLTTGSLEPGHSIVMTKTAGLEGTAILAADYAHVLEKYLDQEQLEEAQGLGSLISIVGEARIGARHGATAMHDATEGGVLGAAWEMAQAAGTGLELWIDRIPVDPITEAVCRVFEADPLRLIASGVLLMGVDPHHEGELLQALDRGGVPAAVIGRATDLKEGRQWTDGTQRGDLPSPESDELWRIKERVEGQKRE